MRLQQNKLQRVKAAIHGVQALLIFVAGCLTLAVMTQNGGHGGETSFYFALCFLTMPALSKSPSTRVARAHAERWAVYQVMVPMWSRAWRLNNVWAYASIDVLSALLWFAASVAVAVWNSRAIAKGKSTTTEENTTTKRADESVKKDGTCESFAYGSATKCSISKATVGFGVIVFFMFCVTAAIAFHAIKQYRQNGTVPNTNFRRKEQNGGALDDGDGGKDVWDPSTEDVNTADDRLAYGQDTEPHEGLLGSERRSSVSDGHSHMDAEGLVHPGRRTPSWHATEQTANLPPYDERYAPSALSPPGFASPNGTVQFPEANYNALR